MRSHPMIASSWSNTWWTLSRYHKLQCAYCQQISRSISKMVLWAFLAIWWLTGPGKSSLAQTLTNNNGLMTCFHMNWWTMMTYELLMINLTFPGPPVFPAKWLSSWLPRFRKTAETIEKDPWNLQRAADALREWWQWWQQWVENLGWFYPHHCNQQYSIGGSLPLPWPPRLSQTSSPILWCRAAVPFMGTFFCSPSHTCC